MKEYLKRGLLSFSLSSFSGLIVNLIIDAIANSAGDPPFYSMSPDFRALFTTPAMAAYTNVLLYGVIGFAFAAMTFLFDLKKMGLLIQWLLYFLSTGAVCITITTLLWQLHRYPRAFFMTVGGYGITYIIIAISQYLNLKKDVKEINESLKKAS